jgi:hypothetical protein
VLLVQLIVVVVLLCTRTCTLAVFMLFPVELLYCICSMFCSLQLLTTAAVTATAAAVTVHMQQVLGRAIAEERDDDDDDNMLFGRSLLPTNSSTTGIAANANTGYNSSSGGASVAGQRSPPRPGFVKIGSIKRQPSSGR